jgi:hypothetical protein
MASLVSSYCQGLTTVSMGRICPGHPGLHCFAAGAAKLETGVYVNFN